MSGTDTTPCPECGVAPGVLHKGGCFFLTGDPADLHKNRVLHGDCEEGELLDVVFDGPPSHESGRFVEVENMAGASVRAGEWIDRGDGLWALRLRVIPS